MVNLDQKLSILDHRKMDLKSPEVAVDASRSRYSSFVFGTAFRDFDAVLTGYEWTLPTYLIDRSTFPTYALELVTGGRGTLWLNGDEHRLRHGSIFTYGPGIRHRITSDAAEPLKKYFIDVVNIPKNLTQIPKLGICAVTSITDRLATLFDGILEDDIGGIGSPVTRYHSLALILHLTDGSTLQEYPPPGVAHQTYLKAKLYFESNYHHTGSVADFAQSLHLDSAYLTRLFQRFAPETPYRFLTRLRLARASHLLLRDNLQIQQISETVGFSDPFHFSTLFRRHYGVSPRRFRTFRQQEDVVQ